jgi:hypothetical protein
MIKNSQLGIISGSIYDSPITSTSAKYLQGRMPALGDKVEFDDGRVYRFCSTAANLSVSQVVAVATCANAELAVTAAAVGSTQITVATTGTAMFGGSTGVLAADRLAGGYLVVQDDTGEGYSYRIKSNAAATSAVALVITLWDPLHVALASDSDVVLIGPKYRYVVEGTATLKSIGAIMHTTTAGTDGTEEFVWVQTKGPGMAAGAGTIGLTLVAAASGVVADNAEASVAVQEVGVALSTAANGSIAIDWMLE